MNDNFLYGGNPKTDVRAFQNKQRADDQEFLRRRNNPGMTNDFPYKEWVDRADQFLGADRDSPKQATAYNQAIKDTSDRIKRHLGISPSQQVIDPAYDRMLNRARMLGNNPGMVEDLKDQMARQRYDQRMAAARARTPEAQQYAAEKKMFKRTGQRTGSLLEDYLEGQREQQMSQPENVANRAQSLMDSYLQAAQRGGQGGQYQKSQANTLNMLRDTLGRLDPTSTEPLDFRTQNIFDLTSGFLRDQQQQQIQSQLSGLFDRPAAQPLTGFSQGPMTQPIQGAQNPMRDQFGQYKGVPAGAQSSMNQGLLGSPNVPGAPTTRANRMNAPLGFSAPQNMPSDFQNQYGLSQLRY